MPMNNKKTAKLIILIAFSMLLLMCCCVFTLIISGMSEESMGKFTTKTIKDGVETQKVAVINLDGIITSYKMVDLWGNETPSMSEDLMRKIDTAKNDDNVKAVLLKVNSPGGEAFASKEIYNKLREFKESGKPLVVQMQDAAASGGYYVSLPADEIIASSITTTGSIGVIITGTDFQGLYEKVGIKEFRVINTEGDLKVLENLNDKDSESYKILQSILDDVYDDFVDAVVESRGLSRSSVIQISDGRVYSGKQAEEVGLVDTIGETATAMASVETLAGLDNPKYITYESKSNPFSLYSLSIKKILFPESSVLEQKSPGFKVQYLMQI